MILYYCIVGITVSEQAAIRLPINQLLVLILWNWMLDLHMYGEKLKSLAVMPDCCQPLCTYV